MTLHINVSCHYRVKVTTDANGTVTIILEPIRA
jgi:hypothetical protein